MEISDEAKMCQKKLRHVNMNHPSYCENVSENIIQQAINEATAAKDAEIERLRSGIEKAFRAGWDFGDQRTCTEDLDKTLRNQDEDWDQYKEICCEIL